MLYRFIWPLALIAVALLPRAHSAILSSTNCSNPNGPGSCTLAELMNTTPLTPTSIQAGDLIFSDFTPWSNPQQGFLVNATQIVVTGVDPMNLDPGPGLHFDLGGQFGSVSSPAGKNIDVITSFTVGPAGPASNLIKDSSLILVFGASTGGSLAGVEQVLLDTSNCIPMVAGEPCTHSLDYTSGTASVTVSSEFDFDPVTSTRSQLTIRVFSSGGSGDLEEFQIHFSQISPPVGPPPPIGPLIPEPGTLSLMAWGLFAAGIVQRRRDV